MRALYLFVPVAILLVVGCAAQLSKRAMPIEKQPQFSGDVARLSDLDEAPIRLGTQEPVRPKNQAEGEAVVAFIVDQKGETKDVQVAKATDAALAEAAIATVKTWRFRPGMKAGKPTACVLYVPVKFGAGPNSASLTEQEMDEIKEQLKSRPDYVLDSVVRESDDVIVVTLTLKADRYKALLLHFDRKNDRWIENKAKAEETEYLIP